MFQSSARSSVARRESLSAAQTLSLLFAVAMACCLAAGCVTSQGDDGGELPWATQESWEGTPAVPGLGTGGGGSQSGGGL